MATLPAKVWHDSYTGILTATGAYRACYHPRQDGSQDSEKVLIVGPGDALHRVSTPGLGGFWLAVENERLVVYYCDTNKVEHREDSGIPCGQPVGATTFGGVGPMGPTGGQGPQGPAGKDAQVTEAQLAQMIAQIMAHLDTLDYAWEMTEDDLNRIAQRVWTLEAGPHAGLSGTDMGTMAQQNVAYPFTRQDVKVRELVAEDEAVAGMKVSGFQPKGV